MLRDPSSSALAVSLVSHIVEEEQLLGKLIDAVNSSESHEIIRIAKSFASLRSDQKEASRKLESQVESKAKSPYLVGLAKS